MRRQIRAISLTVLAGIVLAACSSGGQAIQNPGPAGHWVKSLGVPGVVDLAGPGGDGAFIVAANGRLFSLSRAGVLTPFAQGQGGYSTAIGPEPYITMAGSDQVAGTRCSFRSGETFALEPGGNPGIIMVSAAGRASRLASLPAAGLPTGITYDSVGRFGHLLLVTDRGHTATSVLGIDCAGRIRTITSTAPDVEGGMAVAPASFGSYGGDLVAADEFTGLVFAIRPDGTVVRLAVSGLPHGRDIGVESAGFVPPGFGATDAAYLADRFTKGNPHPGTNNILRLPGSDLIKAGVHAGDLLFATEASARTIVVRCTSTCTVRYIAIGPAITHAEGHIAFSSGG
jgi:hypothetical protein